MPVDDPAEREVGTEMRAPGALHHGPARPIAIGDHAAPQESTADRRVGDDVAGQGDGIPAAMEALVGFGLLFERQLALRTDHAHRSPPMPELVPLGTKCRDGMVPVGTKSRAGMKK